MAFEKCMRTSFVPMAVIFYCMLIGTIFKPLKRKQILYFEKWDLIYCESELVRSFYCCHLLRFDYKLNAIQILSLCYKI